MENNLLLYANTITVPAFSLYLLVCSNPAQWEDEQKCEQP